MMRSGERCLQRSLSKPRICTSRSIMTSFEKPVTLFKGPSTSLGSYAARLLTYYWKRNRTQREIPISMHSIPHLHEPRDVHEPCLRQRYQRRPREPRGTISGSWLLQYVLLLHGIVSGIIIFLLTSFSCALITNAFSGHRRAEARPGRLSCIQDRGLRPSV